MSLVLSAVLVGQHPSGKNQQKIVPRMEGGYMRIPEKSFERWRATAYAQLDRQRGRWPKLRARGHVVVRYTPGDLLTRDVPGLEDALSHVLEWCPVHRGAKQKAICRAACGLPFVVNDGLLDWWEWKPRLLDRAAPRLELTVRPYDLAELA